MSKFLKMTYSFIGIVLLSILGWVIGITAPYVSLPATYNWLEWDIANVPSLLDPILHHYYFWGAIILFVLTLVVILVIMFYPRLYTEIKLDKGNGSLLLKKSAIESYVATAVQSAGLMTNPNVTVKLYKHRFRIDVTGRLASRVGVEDQVSGLKKGIEKGLSEFFGIDKPVHFKVFVKDITDAEYKRAAKQRVE